MDNGGRKRKNLSSTSDPSAKRRRIEAPGVVRKPHEGSVHLNSKESKKVTDPPSSKILPSREISEISAPHDADWEGEWISATATRNYLLKDPIVDWLKYNYSGFVTRNPAYTKDILRAVNDRRNPNSFTEYIMEQGCTFESHVMRLLTEKFGKDLVISIGGELNPHSSEKVEETMNAMNLGVPIIHSGLLHNPETKTYGIPDLIVRSDWINNIFKIHVLDRASTRIPAPRLRDIHDERLYPRYHYLIVDIKFSTLSLRADGVHILNNGSFPAYKSQLYIYNEALARIQGYNPDKAYILGRKWRFSSKGETYKGKSCFDRAGMIDYSGIDKEYVEKTRLALKWLRDCRTEEAKLWNITSVPLEREELYPNMSNTHDYPWHNAKLHLADQIKELTSLWMVGTKHRDKAHSSEIYQWTDKRCTPENIGITGNFTSRILNKVLEINQPHRNPTGILVSPPIILNNLKGWQTKGELEFYVDFETVNDAITDFKALPNIENTSLIFMIGVGFIEPISGRWTYKDFTVNRLSFKEEGRICSEFAEYIRSEAIFYEVENLICIHWASAEDNFWSDAVERHAPDSDKWRTDEWEWMDLLKVFKEEPIVVKGALNFSLKTIANSLRSHGLITSGWDSGSSCFDGQGAMVGAWRVHKEAKLRGLSMREVPLMREIVKYNEVDVKVLQEIIGYLRTYHTSVVECEIEGDNEASKCTLVIEMESDDTHNQCFECQKKLNTEQKGDVVNESSSDDEYESVKDLVEEIRDQGDKKSPLDESIEMAIISSYLECRHFIIEETENNTESATLPKRILRPRRIINYNA